MTGKDLQNVLKEKGVNLSELADFLHLSPQNLNSKFKAQDIGVGFLKKVATSTKIPLSEFLEMPELATNQLKERGVEYNNEYKQKYIDCMEEKEILYKQLLATRLEKEPSAATIKK